METKQMLKAEFTHVLSMNTCISWFLFTVKDVKQGSEFQRVQFNVARKTWEGGFVVTGVCDISPDTGESQEAESLTGTRCRYNRSAPSAS